MPARPRPARASRRVVPLTYLVCAAVAFLAAAQSVAWLAPELAGHYYHPRVLALTHTVTLGWVTLAIMGASYQLIPIVLEREIWSERLARWQLAVLAVAVTGMVAHFQLGTWPGLAAAAGLLAVGIALHLLNVGMSLRGFTRWTFTARLVVLAYGGLALTTALRPGPGGQPRVAVPPRRAVPDAPRPRAPGPPRLGGADDLRRWPRACTRCSSSHPRRSAGTPSCSSGA